MELRHIINSFFQFVQHENVEIYNEFSLQHELGIYLRGVLPNYKVQFERNVSFFTSNTNTIKKEIDISIFTNEKQEKYAIELKCPLNGQHPEQMYSFVKDIRFMEQLRERGFTKNYCIVLVSDRPFYEGKDNSGIYNFFRKEHAIYGNIYKPTGQGKNIDCITIAGRYEFFWKNLDGRRKFYIIEI